MPGLLDLLRGGFGAMGGSAPAVPADGSMQPTIGPGMPQTPAVPYRPKLGLPPGGLLGLMQGGNPQGLMGLLQHLTAGQPQGGAPLAGAMPQAGMLPGMPASPMAGPAAPPPQLPTDINPMNQF
jgi:hypothetical protein